MESVSTNEKLTHLPVEKLFTHFYTLAHFLDRNGLSNQPLAEKPEDITMNSVIRNFDLSDAGYHFLISYLGGYFKILQAGSLNAAPEYLQNAYSQFLKRD